MTLAEVALHPLPGPLDGLEPGLGSVCGSNLGTQSLPAGTHLRGVEVDTETGLVRVRAFVAVDDVGNVVNPMIVDGQVHGGVAQGIGEALYEEMLLRPRRQPGHRPLQRTDHPGRRRTCRLSITDRTVHAVARPTRWGSKGAGETGAIGSTARGGQRRARRAAPPRRARPGHAVHPGAGLAGAGYLRSGARR